MSEDTEYKEITSPITERVKSFTENVEISTYGKFAPTGKAEVSGVASR
jgi:hypothetical protein